MLQEKGGWSPFTRGEIEAFYQKCGLKDGFRFNRLIQPGITFGIIRGNYSVGGGWVVENEDGTLEVTEEFVERVYKSSPKIDPVK